MLPAGRPGAPIASGPVNGIEGDLEQASAAAFYARNIPFGTQMNAYPSAHAEVGFSYPERPPHQEALEGKQIETQVQNPEIRLSPSHIATNADPSYENYENEKKKDVLRAETGQLPNDHLQPSSFRDEAPLQHKGLEEDEEEPKAKKKEDEYFRKVSFWELFRFATSGDKILIAIAVVCAMANGGELQLPIFAWIFLGGKKLLWFEHDMETGKE
jgi:hypothetical protein